MTKSLLAIIALCILFVQPLSAHALLGDADRDGVPEIALDNGRNTDNCPALFNPDQLDTDHDGLGDACDPEPNQPAPEVLDADHDGIPDARDNCPVVSNPDQRNTDGDLTGDACDDDDDNDGDLDAHDNCPLVVNPDQADLDGDGTGDACDNDVDGDGLPNANDPCPNGNDPLTAPECQDHNNPSVVLRAPANGEVVRSSTVDFNFVVVDNFDVHLNCEIDSDVNGGGIQTITRLQGLTAFFDFFTGFTSNTFTVHNVPDGTYHWFAACIDDNRNRGVSAVATFTIDTQPPQPAGDITAPTIALVAPANNAVLNNGAVVLSFTAQDNQPGQLSCQVMANINGNFRLLGNPVQMDQGANRFAINNIQPGAYQWNVQCTDAAGNTGAAPFKFSFTVQQPPANQCANGVQDINEAGIDCGGVCANACPAPVNQCANGAQDANEQDVDCGGVCANACPIPPVPPGAVPPIVAVTSVPQVSLTASPREGTAPLRVTFTAGVSGGDGPFRFAWNFGDGTFVETRTATVEHTFEKPGRYDVSVRVIDIDGDSRVATILIRVHSTVRDGERDLRLGPVLFESAGGYDIYAGDQVVAMIGLTNTGAVPLRNLKMTLSSFDMELHQQLALASLQSGETVTKRMIIEVPPATMPGEYMVRLAITDENQLTKVTYHPLIVVG